MARLWRWPPLNSRAWRTEAARSSPAFFHQLQGFFPARRSGASSAKSQWLADDLLGRHPRVERGARILKTICTG